MRTAKVTGHPHYTIEEAAAGPIKHKPVEGPIKIFGGKGGGMAAKIVALMPPHTTYVEPFFGGGSVLLAKEPAGAEIANDRHGHLANFWQVVQNPILFREFTWRVNNTPFSQASWREAQNRDRGGPVEWAANYFIRVRQGFAGDGATFAAITKTRLRRGMQEQVSAWLSAVDRLPEVHERMMRVLVLNDYAMAVMKAFDSKDTLIYADPPYLHETRTQKTVYEFEMSDSDHYDLLLLARDLKAKVMISGYRSKMYDEMLEKWKRHEFSRPNQAAAGKTKRRMVECVWVNF